MKRFVRENRFLPEWGALVAIAIATLTDASGAALYLIVFGVMVVLLLIGLHPEWLGLGRPEGGPLLLRERSGGDRSRGSR